MAAPQYFPIGAEEENVIIPVYIASLTDLAVGVDGLAFDSTNLDCFYSTDQNSSGTEIALVTATMGTYTSAGFIEMDATDDEHTGWYQFGLPNSIVFSAKPAPRWVLLSFEEDGGTALGIAETHVFCPVMKRGFAWGL